jgi:hypothetical protein
MGGNAEGHEGARPEVPRAVLHEPPVAAIAAG